MICAVPALQEKKGRKTPLAVPQPSLLARHDNTVRPSLFFSRPCQGKALVLLSTAKGEVRPPQDLSFYGDGRKAEGGKNIAEEAQKRKFWRDLICRFAGVDALLGALSEGPEQKNVHSRCFKRSLIYSLALVSSLPHLEVFLFLRGKLREWVGRFRKRLDVFLGPFVRKP